QVGSEQEFKVRAETDTMNESEAKMITL
ncbi:MAG: hypothetical protein QG674_209, partial [Patescibacteria group bacterium]|nr:hypothetical protein [Patescibacteria group bacterium]